MLRPSKCKSANVRELVYKLKNKISGLALRTTFIVGFPGETDKMFGELCDFVSEGLFDHVGIFKFSAQTGTKAAKYAKQINEKVKDERFHELMCIQKNIVEKKNQKLQGSIFEVLVEGRSNKTNMLFGRTNYQAPEVDSVVYFCGKSSPGTFTKVEITGFKDYDLIGKELKYCK
jgi:ribosomal protein S12 methylthiotransferase